MQLGITKEEFIELYNNSTYREIQDKLKLNPNQVAKIVKELGLSKPKGRKKEPIIFESED